MTAHRYWRATALESYGGGEVEITEFHLLSAGARVDAPATLTASESPTAGTVANIQDDVLTTGALWSAADAKTLVLKWDFGLGGDAEVDDIRLGSASDISKFLLNLGVQWSDDDATWSTSVPVVGIAWPGVRAKTTSGLGGIMPLRPEVISMLNFDGENGDTVFYDEGSDSLTWSARGSAAITSLFGKRGNSLGISTGNNSSIVTPDTVDLDIDSGDFTIEWWGRQTSRAGAGFDTAFQMSTIATATLATGYDSRMHFLQGTNPLGHVFRAANTTLTGWAVDLSLGTLPSLNEWHHNAVVRFGDTWTVYLDGVAIASTTYSGAVAATDIGMEIGQANQSGAANYRGQIDLFRIVRGIAVYTADFTPGHATSYAGGITRNKVIGRIDTIPLSDIPTGAGQVPVFGLTAIEPMLKDRKDYLTGVLGEGLGRVAGTVKEIGDPNTPVYRRVRLIRERDGLLIREVWSDPATGAYEFEYVDELQKYTILSYDHMGVFRAVVADRITPELMT